MVADPQILMLCSDQPADSLRSALLTWYQAHGRKLPWRFSENSDRPRSVYAIWVSEIMLQQTQVQTVLPYFDRWLHCFPDLATLANADQQAVLKQWQGLGYYARARNFHRAAQIVMSEHQGIFPQTYAEVLALPGIGRSTAGGILSSAFNLPLPILDGNVKRVLARLIALQRPSAEALADLWQCSTDLLDPDHPRDFNQALMDLGATVCLPKNPRCAECPWQEYCQAYQLGLQNTLPQRKASVALPHKYFSVAMIKNEQGGILVDRRYESALLGGLWEFPNILMADQEANPACLEAEIAANFGIEIKVENELLSIDHAYTHFRATFRVYRCYYIGGTAAARTCDEVRWMALDDLHQLPFSKANLKIIAAGIGFQ